MLSILLFLTAEEAVQIALEGNGSLAAQRTDIDRARAAKTSAAALPNPSVEIGLVEEGQTGLYEIEAEVPISDVLLAPLRVRPAGRALERTRLQTAAAGVQLTFEVRAAFYASQAAERQLSVTSQAVDGWAAAVEASRALYAAGNIPELDLAVQESAYEQARVALAARELDLVVSRERLSRLLGREERRPLAPLASTPAIEIPPDLEARALAASLELRALDAAIDTTTEALTAARVDAVLPDVSAFVRSETLWGLPSAEAGLHVTAPLFSLGRGEIASLGAERRGAVAQREQLEIEIQSAAREARARLLSAHDRALRFETVVLPARARASRQTLLQYNAMQVGIYQLLDARREELDAHASLADLLAECWTAQAALDALLAGVRVDTALPATPTETRAPSAAGGH